MTNIYEPSKGLLPRIRRRLTNYQAQNKVAVPTDRKIISFTFDDCPLSGIHNGISLLEKENWLSTVYVACGLFDVVNHHGRMMGSGDVTALNDNGHEIGGHTFSHLDANSVDFDSFIENVEKNQAKLNQLGAPVSQTFAYPYGQAYPKLKKAMQARFNGARGIRPVAHSKSVDLNQIGSVPLFAGTTKQAVQAINNLGQTGGWLTLFTHDVRNNPSHWGCTTENMKAVITAAKDIGADVMTIENAIAAIGRAA